MNKYTRLSLNNYNIDNIELRGNYFGYDLDHIYSKINGFKNGIPAYIIGCKIKDYVPRNYWQISRKGIFRRNSK